MAESALRANSTLYPTLTDPMIQFMVDMRTVEGILSDTFKVGIMQCVFSMLFNFFTDPFLFIDPMHCNAVHD